MKNAIIITVDRAELYLETIQTLNAGNAGLSSFIANDYRLFLQGNKEAAKGLIKLWELCEADSKESLATIRTLFNRVTKKIHKEMSLNLRAIVVVDGELVEAQARAAKKSKVAKISDDSPRLKSASEQLSRMLKNCSDEAEQAAIETALALIASV